MANHRFQEEPKSLAQLFNTMKYELSDFVNTRVQMLVSEVQDKVGAWKAALPMLGAAAFLGVVGFFAFTFTLIALLAELIGGDFAWTIGSGIVTLVYLGVAGVLGWIGYREVKAEGIVPSRTLRILKQDQDWIKNEARSA